MKLFSINNVTSDTISEVDYDLRIFCSGFESRCTFIPENIKWGTNSDVIIFGFNDTDKSIKRIENDSYFIEKYGNNIKQINGNDDLKIYAALNSYSFAKDSIKIFIDYSSMTRTWYAALLNWCRYQTRYTRIIIDFGYSIGDYTISDRPMVIKEISAVSGFEGSSLDRNKSTLVFGLGFEGDAALCVLERLEPDNVYTYRANPAASELALDYSLSINDELIKTAKYNLEISIYDVCDVFQSLTELIRPYLTDSRITLVPMGPKPHILGALLLNIRYPTITCLHVSGRGEKGEDVKPNGQMVLTKVEFKR